MAEAEYMALAPATQEALWLRSLLRELGFKQDKSLPIKEDNVAAIYIARDPMYPKRTKHIDIKHHFIRDNVRDGAISVEYIPSKNNLADLLTKALPKADFENLNQHILRIEVPFHLKSSV